MAGKKGLRTGQAYKNAYKQYKLENRWLKNKIKKLNRHIKKFPEDAQAQEALKRIEKGDTNRRKKPVAPNPVKPKRIINNINCPEGIKTAKEQLCELLGIPFKPSRPKKYAKAPIRYKKKRNVKKS